jgi:hypothetical protein
MIFGRHKMQGGGALLLPRETADRDIGAASWPKCARCRRAVDAYGIQNENSTSIEIWAECRGIRLDPARQGRVARATHPLPNEEQRLDTQGGRVVAAAVHGHRQAASLLSPRWGSAVHADAHAGWGQADMGCRMNARTRKRDVHLRLDDTTIYRLHWLAREVGKSGTLNLSEIVAWLAEGCEQGLKDKYADDAREAAVLDA